MIGANLKNIIAYIGKICTELHIRYYIITKMQRTLFMRRLYRPDCVTRSFQRALKRHDLPVMRFHDLRHSTASILFDKGWDPESVKSWLRHADIETTSNIYLHISNGRKRLMAKDMTGTFIAPYSAKDNSGAENE